MAVGGFGHIPALDGVRGLAVIAVVLHHTSIIGWGGFFQYDTPLGTFLMGGVMGVDIFFVLSGFLITSILLKEYGNHRSISLLNFYMRRILRLYPALLVTIAFSAILVLLGEISMRPQMLLYALTYTSNFAWLIEGKTGLLEASSLLVHTWSLAVEEQFYLIWPLLLILLLFQSSRGVHFTPSHMLGIIAVLMVVCFAFQWWALLFAEPFIGLKLATRTLIGRAGALLSGCAVAVIMFYPNAFDRTRHALTHWVTQAIAIVGLIALLGFFQSHGKHIVYNSPFIAFVSASLIAGLVNSHRSPSSSHLGSLIDLIFSWRPLRYIGRISYGIYLYHVPIFFLFPATWLMETSPQPVSSILVFVLPTLITLTIAAASYHVIESPMLRLKERFHRSVL